MAGTVWPVWTVWLACLCAPAAALAQTKAADTCAFEGTARNLITRQGIAQVSIYLVPMNGSPGYAGASDSTGEFHFRGVVPGDYTLQASRPDFDDKFVLHDSAARAISTLHLKAGQAVHGATVWLTPQSVISGKVIGPDGEPLSDAQLILIAQEWRRGKRVYDTKGTASSEDTGEYRLTVHAPGRYFVYAARPVSGPLALTITDGVRQPATVIAGRYYPNAAQLADATPVDLHGGEEIAGLDFHLPLVPVHHVTGRAVPGPGEGRNRVILSPRLGDQPLAWASESAELAADGTFDIATVPPGNYWLAAYQVTARDSVQSPRIPLTMEQQDIAGVAAPTAASFTLKGRVRVEGDPPAGRIPVDILCDASDADEYMALLRRTQPDLSGGFEVKNLSADVYTVRIANRETGKDGGYYLKTVRIDDVPVPNGDVDFKSGIPGDIEIVLSSGVGSVEGTVQAPDPGESATTAEPPAELTVVLAPDRLASGQRRPAVAYLDQDARFRLTDLEPGRYRAFAVTNYDAGLWQNDNFLRQIAGRGAELEIQEKTVARVEAPLVPASEVRRVEELVR